MYGEMGTITELTRQCTHDRAELMASARWACDAGTTVTMPRRTRYDS